MARSHVRGVEGPRERREALLESRPSGAESGQRSATSVGRRALDALRGFTGGCFAENRRGRGVVSGVDVESCEGANDNREDQPHENRKMPQDSAKTTTLDPKVGEALLDNADVKIMQHPKMTEALETLRKNPAAYADFRRRGSRGARGPLSSHSRG